MSYAKWLGTFAKLLADVGTTTRESQTFATLTLGERTELEFVAEQEFCTLRLLSLDMQPHDEEVTRALVAYRIDSNKQKTALMQGRLKEILKTVQEVNPALFNHLGCGKPWTSEFSVSLE